MPCPYNGTALSLQRNGLRAYNATACGPTTERPAGLQRNGLRAYNGTAWGLQRNGLRAYNGTAYGPTT